MKYLKITVRQVILRIAIVIAVAELLIMIVLNALLSGLSGSAKAALDVIFLVLISSPVIYYWIINPFKQERDGAIRSLSDMAYTDPLTGVPNRRVFLECLERTLAESSRHHIHAALILIDLDGFKNINDSYGHDTGDAVLIEIGQRLQRGVRVEDVVSRVGGDEFIILIKQLNDDSEKAAEEAITFSKKIKRSLSEPVHYQDKVIQIDASLGINMLSAETNKIEAEIRKADIAMYHAKRQGNGHVAMYHPKMVSRETRRG